MFADADRNALLLEIYGRKGWSEKQQELLNHMFRSNYSVRTLEALLAVVGEDRRDELVETAVADILQSANFSHTNLSFLLDIRRYQEAEDYLVNHAEQIIGDYYTYWLLVTESMEKAGLALAASLVYRALLLSILARANTTIYPHGARYLRKLDRLAGTCEDWRGVEYTDLAEPQFRRMLSQSSGKSEPALLRSRQIDANAVE